MQRLKGKVIFLAGGGGIGAEIARRYAQEGARLLLGDIDMAGAEGIVEEIRQSGGEAVATRLDGSDQQSIHAAVALCRDSWGGLDGFHANFAQFEDYSRETALLDLPMALYDQLMHVNARGFLLCTKAVLPEMIARGGGAIIYTGSIAAYRGDPDRVAYAMSKAAILALMRHVASRHGKDGVRANVIAPGIIFRPNQPESFTSELVGWATGNASIKSRIGQPTDIAALSALLMSEEGSFITGQSIAVDGGFTMRP